MATANTKTNAPEVVKNRIFPGMPIHKFEDICRSLFEVHESQNTGTLGFSDFKEFTVELEREAGLPEEDIQTLKRDGTNRTWMAIFALYDINGDGQITWDEAWNFLKNNPPPAEDK